MQNIAHRLICKGKTQEKGILRESPSYTGALSWRDIPKQKCFYKKRNVKIKGLLGWICSGTVNKPYVEVCSQTARATLRIAACSLDQR